MLPISECTTANVPLLSSLDHGGPWIQLCISFIHEKSQPGQAPHLPEPCHISSHTLSLHIYCLEACLQILCHIPCTEQRFPWSPPQLHSGLLSRPCLFTEDGHSTTKFPWHQIKSGETHCFDSPLKSILINYSVLKYCSGLINLIKT